MHFELIFLNKLHGYNCLALFSSEGVSKRRERSKWWMGGYCFWHTRLSELDWDDGLQAADVFVWNCDIHGGASSRCLGKVESWQSSEINKMGRGNRRCHENSAEPSVTGRDIEIAHVRAYRSRASYGMILGSVYTRWRRGEPMESVLVGRCQRKNKAQMDNHLSSIFLAFFWDRRSRFSLFLISPFLLRFEIFD